MAGLCRALSPLCCFAASGAVEGWVLSSDRPTPGNVFCPAFLVLSLVRQPLLPGQSKTLSSLFSGMTTTLCYVISHKTTTPFLGLFCVVLFHLPRGRKRLRKRATGRESVGLRGEGWGVGEGCVCHKIYIYFF